MEKLEMMLRTLATDGRAGIYMFIAKGLKKPAMETHATMKYFVCCENTSWELPWNEENAVEVDFEFFGAGRVGERVGEVAGV